MGGMEGWGLGFPAKAASRGGLEKSASKGVEPMEEDALGTGWALRTNSSFYISQLDRNIERN